MAISRHSVVLRRFAHLGAARGPLWFLRYSPPLIGCVAAVLSSDARHRVIDNLHRIRGPAPKWRDALETMETFGSFAGALAESLAAGSKNERPVELTIEGREHLEPVLGGPFIVGTIHSGGWDVMGTLLASDYAVDVLVAMAHEVDPRAEKFHDGVRGRTRVRIAHVGSDPLAALPLLAQLRRGGVVAMQLDRTPPGMRALPVHLLGTESTIPEGPFHLARLARVPILPIFCARLGFRRYRIVIHPAIRLQRDASTEETTAAARSFAEKMTSFLREHPSQWFNF
jgi:KDO2-lipid IV(A) lauroyltransferase